MCIYVYMCIAYSSLCRVVYMCVIECINTYTNMFIYSCMYLFLYSHYLRILVSEPYVFAVGFGTEPQVLGRWTLWAPQS